MLGGAAWGGALSCQVHLLLDPVHLLGLTLPGSTWDLGQGLLLEFLEFIRESEDYVEQWEQVVAPSLWELSAKLAGEGCVC